MMTGLTFYLFTYVINDEGVMLMEKIKVLGLVFGLTKNVLAISTYRVSY